MLGKVIALSRHGRPSRMKRSQILDAQILPFRLRSPNDSRPVRVRNAFPLPPLADSPMALTNISSHLRDGVPVAEDLVKGHSNRYNASDELSGQARPIIPQTELRPVRTMRPMGRGVTPSRFRAEMAEKLYSARMVAGYKTQQEAATALGVGLDRYRKWETGRTPVPAQYVSVVCATFGVDANYLFSVMPRVIRKTA